MPRKFIRRLNVRYRGNQASNAWYLRPFRAMLEHPVYFSINRRSVTGAVALGLFIAMLPLPIHTLLALLIGLVLRVNLPVAIVVIWVANPLTYAPILYGEYRLGAWLMGLPALDLDLDQSWTDLAAALVQVWQPLWMGALVGGVVLAALGYGLTNAAWGVSTRWRYRRRLRNRGQASPPA